MDVVKVFVEEPVGLEVVAADADPDARRRSADLGPLDALLGRAAPPYARAYLAGTVLGDAPPAGGPPRVGLTALADPDAWLAPLLDWAGDRPWTRLAADGRGGPQTGGAATRDEAAAALRAPDGTLALALGPASPDALAEAAAGGPRAGGPERRDALPALRRVLDAGGGAAALFPEPAHDGWDWSVFARAPLEAALRAAFARHPAPPGARRFVAPYRRARGEHTFYFEQWALDPPPAWADAL